MMCYLGAPISLGFRAGEGAPTLCSKDSHGPQPAGAAGKEEGQEDEAGQWDEGLWLSDSPSVSRGIVLEETGLERARTCLGYHTAGQA